MRVSKLGLLLAALATTPLESAHAQEVLQIGTPVRVSGLDVPGSPVTGMYAGLVQDTVLIGIPGGSDALRLPRFAITHLEVQLGRRSGAARTSRFGMFVGSAASGILAFVVRKRIDPAQGAGIIVGGGALGSMLGGLLGHTLFRAARWVEAPLEMLRESTDEP